MQIGEHKDYRLFRTKRMRIMNLEDLPIGHPVRNDCLLRISRPSLDYLLWTAFSEVILLRESRSSRTVIKLTILRRTTENLQAVYEMKI